MQNHTSLAGYDEVLLPQDVHAILHISRSTLYKYLSDGTIQSIRIGNHYRIPRSCLERFLSPNQTVKEICDEYK